MRIYILGMDGYIGWPLYKALIAYGHKVLGCDNFMRREHTSSLIPYEPGRKAEIDKIDVANNPDGLYNALKVHEPDVVIHLAQIPSAPYSMKNVYNTQYVYNINLNSTISLIYAVRRLKKKPHIIKLGSLGEYKPSSWYHLTKVYDSAGLKWACENFGITCTDVMQGPVYGVGGRFDYDEVWGTVINRWICMGITGHALLVYGDGSQIRGLLPIQDSVACLNIIANNPPVSGEYRVVNQYAQKYTIKDIALMISEMTNTDIKYIHNPRIEAQNYNVVGKNTWLIKHGYKPTLDMQGVIAGIINQVHPYKHKIDTAKFNPIIKW